MRKDLFGQSECRGEAVCYYLLAEEHEGLGESYGLQVRCGEETEMIPDITSSQRHIQMLLEVLMAGSVTPATAREVIDDWLNG